jgi:hypothetical protein
MEIAGCTCGFSIYSLTGWCLICLCKVEHMYANSTLLTSACYTRLVCLLHVRQSNNLPNSCCPAHSNIVTSVTAAALGSQSSLIATTPIANSIGDTLLLYAAMANTSYPDARAPSKLSLPQELLAKHERSAANSDWILGSEQPLQNIKIGLCRQVGL